MNFTSENPKAIPSPHDLLGFRVIQTSRKVLIDGYIFPYSVTFCHTPTKNPPTRHPVPTFLIKFHCIPFDSFWLFLNKKIWMCFGYFWILFFIPFSFLFHCWGGVESGLRVGKEYILLCFLCCSCIVEQMFGRSPVDISLHLFSYVRNVRNVSLFLDISKNKPQFPI